MGEIPLEVPVHFGDDETEHVEYYVVYWCSKCSKDLLIDEVRTDVFCPYCGDKTNVTLEVELT